MKNNWENILNKYRDYLLLERGMSDNTCEAYLNDLNNLLLYFEEKEIQRLPEQVSYEDLISFIEYIAEIGFSDKTQAQILSALKSFFKFMLLEDLIAKDPTKLLETPRLGRKLPAVLSVEEIETILGAIDVSTQLGHRNRAIIEVLYGCGLRVTELTELKISNIFYDEDFIRVIGKGDKQRLVPLGRKAKEEIDNYFKSFRNHIEPKKGNGDFLFLNRRGSKLTRVMVFNIVKEACATAGIKKNISPHTFRHSFATHLIEGGAGLRVVQEMLGHESITTTEIYTHLDREFLRETIIQFHPRS